MAGQKVEGSESGKAEKWLTEGQRGEQEQQDAAPAQRRTHRCVLRLVMSVWTRGRGRSSRRSSQREEPSGGGVSVCAGERTADCQLTSSLSARVLVYYPESDIDLGVRTLSLIPASTWHAVAPPRALLSLFKNTPWNNTCWAARPEVTRNTRERYGRRQTFLRLQRPLLLMPFICTCAADFTARRGILMYRLPPLD